MATYLILNIVFICAMLLIFKLRWPQPWRQALLVLAVLFLLTLIFDNLIIGLGIVSYDSARISGLRAGLAPLEDFAYPVLACILLPALWERFKK